MKKSEIIKLLRETYEKRLSQSLDEADLVDNKNNVIVSRDLKVRDKRSGYEYTVDSVRTDNNGKNVIVLRPPDAPRFKPPAKAPKVISSSEPELDVYVPGMKMKHSSKMKPMVVSQKDFEKNFEVE
jgi:hypothetical protein